LLKTTIYKFSGLNKFTSQTYFTFRRRNAALEKGCGANTFGTKCNTALVGQALANDGLLVRHAITQQASLSGSYVLGSRDLDPGSTGIIDHWDHREDFEFLLYYFKVTSRLCEPIQRPVMNYHTSYFT